MNPAGLIKPTHSHGAEVPRFSFTSRQFAMLFSGPLTVCDRSPLCIVCACVCVTWSEGKVCVHVYFHVNLD